MYFSDRITLRAVSAAASDGIGDAVKTNTDTIVWANKKSVTRSEFYAASASNIKVTNVFEINSEDWGNQTQVVDGVVYDIVRSYQKGLGTIELMCAVHV
jgi:SPP1 family predicted phage head-tail adaptor